MLAMALNGAVSQNAPFSSHSFFLMFSHMKICLKLFHKMFNSNVFTSVERFVHY